jgi:hypothetical protein
MPSSKTTSDMFEARYLASHPKKFDAQRAAMLKLMKKKKKVIKRKGK